MQKSGWMRVLSRRLPSTFSNSWISSSARGRRVPGQADSPKPHDGVAKQPDGMDLTG
jgi:hypothetical protein